MRDTYPTAWVLGIISAGDFTAPAQELVRSRAIDLFYIPKTKIVEAWMQCGVDIEYDDAATESVKDGSLFHREGLVPDDALQLHLEVGKVAGYFEQYHSHKKL